MAVKTFRRIIHKTPESILKYLQSLYSLSRIKITNQYDGNTILSFIVAPKNELSGISVSLSLMKLPINSSYALNYSYTDNTLIRNYKLIDALKQI